MNALVRNKIVHASLEWSTAATGHGILHGSRQRSPELTLEQAEESIQHMSFKSGGMHGLTWGAFFWCCHMGANTRCCSRVLSL
jgi:hypothetical protein